MLTTIPVLSFLLFGALYPLCFWFIGGNSIVTDFRKFNLGLANFVAGAGIVILLFMPVPWPLKAGVLAWKAVLLSVSSYSWKKEKINLWLILLPVVCGILAVGGLQGYFVNGTNALVPVTMLGGLILCLSFFAMILGHWYLNVPGLPIHYLTGVTRIFVAMLMVRLIWDAGMIATSKILYFGDWMPLYNFMFHIEGFLLLVAVFFGTILPVFLVYLTLETLKVKSTQSATGLLYIVVIAVLMGDLSYKYYLFKYGLVF